MPTPLLAALCAASLAAAVRDGESKAGAASLVWWHGEEAWNPSVRVKGMRNCDSAREYLAHMLDEERHFEIVIGIAGLIATTIALVLCGCVVGAHVKPRHPRYWDSGGCNPFDDNFFFEKDVTDELRAPIQRLLDMTTKPECMGVGRDGAWATHKGFRVLRVTRIENGPLWSDFARTRRAITPTQRRLREMPDGLRRHTESALQAVGKVHAAREADDAVKAFVTSLRLDEYRNERLLFHGSPSMGARHSSGEVLFHTEDCAPAYAIKHSGFDDRLGSVRGMLGSGTYFADMASKADQYSGRYGLPTQGSVGEKATMFLSRVVLGCPYLTTQSLEQLRRPPCVQGHFDLSLFWNEDVLLGKPWREKGLPLRICNHPRFDSIISDLSVDGHRRLYREYVVYERQCYPEFCVHYERVA